MQLTDTKTDIVIDETITKIVVHANFLRLYSEIDIILADIPFNQINSLNILGSNINVPGRLIKICNQYQIPIHFMTDLYKHHGSLYFSVHKNINNRILQFKVLLDEDWSLYLAKQLLNQKILTQQSAFGSWGYDPIIFNKTFCSIIQAKNKLSLMGIEGNAAITYWKAFGEAYNNSCPNIHWKGRIKNPCLDPINSLLSLAYSLLSTQCQTSITKLGLDAYLGMLHTTSELRPALVYDIMEVYRVFLVDYWILALFNAGIYSVEDFRFTKEGVCTLNVDKKNEFFKLWFKRLKHQQFSSNHGPLTIHQFMDINTKRLIDWLELIDNKKQRNTERFDRLPDNLIIFTRIEEFKIINPTII